MRKYRKYVGAVAESEKLDKCEAKQKYKNTDDEEVHNLIRCI